MQLHLSVSTGKYRSLTMASATMDKTKRNEVPWWTSCRFGLAIMLFFGFINLYALRVNMSVAMVCMVNQTWLQSQQHNTIPGELPVELPGNVTHTPFFANQTPVVSDTCAALKSSNASSDGEFQWHKDRQGLVLGSFFWGYILTQVPGGWLAARFGGKRVYGYAMLMAALATLLMPIAAQGHYILLMVLRIICGIGQGVVWPAVSSMWAYWAPPRERSKLAGFANSGSQLGNVITMPIAALLCEYGFNGGWPSIFYVFGSLGVVWCILWLTLVADTPECHPRISDVEREYIQDSLKGHIKTTRDTKMDIPWRSFFTSGPVWGIIITHGLANFGTYTFMTNMPTYMKEVLKFDIKSNGFFSALPYIGMWLVIVVSSNLSDLIRSKRLMNTTQTRKLFNSLGLLVPALSCLALGFVDCHTTVWAIVILVIGVSGMGFQYGGGFILNHVDIAPKYAALLFGMSNTVATIPGFVAPIVIGALTPNQSQEEWRSVFYIAAAIYVVGALAYLILGSGNLQPWAKESDDPDLEVKIALEPQKQNGVAAEA